MSKFISSSGKQTQLPLKDVLYLVCTRYSMLPLNLATSILMARTLQPQALGLFTLMFWLPSVLAGPMSFGIGNANLYFAAQNRNLGNALLTNSIFVSLAVSGIVLTVAGIAAFSFREFLPLGLDPAFFIIPLFDLPFRLLKMFILNLFNAFEDHSRYRIVESSQTVLYTAFCFVTVVAYPCGVWNFVFSEIAACSIACIYSLCLVSKHCRAIWKIDPVLLRKSISYGIKVQAGSMLRVASQKLDELIVLHFAGPGMLGFLSLSRNITDKMRIIPYSLGTVILASMTADESSRVSVYKKSAHYIFFVMILLTMLLLAIAVPLVTIIYGSSFSGIEPPLAIFLLSLIPLGIQRMSDTYMLSCGRPEVVVRTGFTSACVLVLLDLALIPIIGISGAAVATLAAMTCDMALLLLYIKQTEGILMADIFRPTAQDWKMFISLLRDTFSRVRSKMRRVRSS